MTIPEMIAVLQASMNGKEIQCRTKDNPNSHWTKARPDWDFHNCDYRVRPEPRQWWACLDNRGGHEGILYTTREEALNDIPGREIVLVQEVYPTMI